MTVAGHDGGGRVLEWQSAETRLEGEHMRERATTPPSRPREETRRLGEAIYERGIRAQVETGHRGEVVAIDVDSGNWAIGDTVIAATDRLWERNPSAHDIWCLRVGHRALHHFGGRPLRRTE